jgi:hypothetical protein
MLPAAWGNWTSLHALFQDGNCLTGTVPASFAGMTNLHRLGLTSNPLTGTLPAAFGELQKMQQNITIDITSTLINSSIPSSWSYFTSGTMYAGLLPSQLHGCLPGSMRVFSCLLVPCTQPGDTDCDEYDDDSAGTLHESVLFGLTQYHHASWCSAAALPFC